MLPLKCRAVLWKTWLHSHSGLSLTDLWKSPEAALPRSLTIYLQSARYYGNRASQRLHPNLYPALQDSRGTQESGADLAEFVETAWAPGLTPSFPEHRQANNQTDCPLVRVQAGAYLTATKIHAITYHWRCSKVPPQMHSIQKGDKCKGEAFSARSLEKIEKLCLGRTFLSPQ